MNVIDIQECKSNDQSKGEHKYLNAFSSSNTDTVDIKRVMGCTPTHTYDVFKSIPINMYDIIILPDCAGDWIDSQENDKRAPDTDRLFHFHNNVLTNVLQALKPGGYLIYSKMLYVKTQKQYVQTMNDWFESTGMPFKLQYFQISHDEPYEKYFMHFYVLHKIYLGECKSIR